MCSKVCSSNKICNICKTWNTLMRNVCLHIKYWQIQGQFETLLSASNSIDHWDFFLKSKIEDWIVEMLCWRNIKGSHLWFLFPVGFMVIVEIYTDKTNSSCGTMKGSWWYTLPISITITTVRDDLAKRGIINEIRVLIRLTHSCTVWGQKKNVILK